MWKAHVEQWVSLHDNVVVVLNTSTGERLVVRTSNGKVARVFDAMPRLFFDAINDCIKKYDDELRSLLENAQPIEPDPIKDVYAEADVNWDDKTVDVNVPEIKRKKHANWKPYRGGRFN